jgi:outer membrane lipoprotein carrier protein
MRRLLFLACCGPLFAAALAAAAPPADPGAPGLSASQRLAALVERVKLEQRGLRTLEADFAQRRESELLVLPEEARGNFAYQAPDKVRWDYREPNPMTILVRGQEMTTWYRDLKRADRLDVGRYSAEVLRYMGASGSLQKLLEYFTVTAVFPAGDEPYRLVLKPRFARIAKRIAEMTIWLDRRRFLPVRLRYLEPDGDTTEYSFTNLRLNAPLAADRFVLAIPKDVEVRSRRVGRDATP